MELLLDGDGEVTCACCNVQDLFGLELAEILDPLSAPILVEPKGEQMIQRVVGVGDLIKHPLHLRPFLLFVVVGKYFLRTDHLLKYSVTFFSIRASRLLVSSLTNVSPVMCSYNSM